MIELRTPIGWLRNAYSKRFGDSMLLDDCLAAHAYKQAIEEFGNNRYEMALHTKKSADWIESRAAAILKELTEET